MKGNKPSVMVPGQRLFGGGWVFLCVVAAAILSLFPAGASAQLLNPGFEADAVGSTTVTDWVVMGGTAQVSDSSVRSGSRSLAHTVPDSATYDVRSASGVTLKGSHYIHVVGRAMCLSCPSGSCPSAKVGIVLNGTVVNNGSALSLGTAWVRFTAAVQGSANNTYYVRVASSSPAGVPATVYWDDVLLYTNKSLNVEDTIAPANPGAATSTGATASSLTVSWGASAGDNDPMYDSGLLGYLVMRGTQDPVTAPVNGVAYRPGYNAALGAGTAVFFGPGVSFVDTGLSCSTTYYYRIYAVDNALNYSSPVTVSGTTLVSCTPPAGPVTLSPASALVNEGGGASFASSLTGAGLNYQWQKDGAAISGAASSSYSIASAVYGDAGNYRVVITNNCGSVTSAVAVLVVNRLPVGGEDQLSTRTNVAVSVSAAKLLANDSDPDGDTLTVTGVGSALPAGSTVGFSGGVATYQPAGGFEGDGSFNYQLSDGRGGTVSVLVKVSVARGATGGTSANVVGDPWIDGTTAEFVARFAGIPGERYTVEWSDTATGSWHALTNRTVSLTNEGFGVGVFEVRDATNGKTSRYYRTVWPAY